MKKIRLGLFLMSLLCCQVLLMAQNRWAINPEGGITWTIDQRIPHEDHIEMSGQKVSTVLRYGVDANGAFVLNRSMVWPMLRTIPNNTHASLMRRFAWKVTDMIEVDGRSLINEKVENITLDGKMTVNSRFEQAKDKVVGLTRILFPSTTQPMFCEKYILKNLSEKTIKVEVPSSTSVLQTDANQGVDGSYKLVATLQGSTSRSLKKGEELTFSVFFIGYKPQELEITPDIEKELTARQALVDELRGKLVLKTPNATINTLFAFSKIRGAESIYLTKGGFMHGPGGESYYAALWANDQAEYINPFFPYLGYRVGNESALNAYLHFARFMNPKYEPIPSSIIAEGIAIWNGAGDRGDAAMIAYGASRYALARGDKGEAEQLWPLIEWTLEYCHRKLNKEGVVTSDSDELEGRFPAGEANLCTSSLYYDALLSAVYLGKSLGKPAAQLNSYAKKAQTLRKAMDQYFGGTVEGFNTYQYYKGNDVLRSWICIPLTVGIYDRKEATINALFSPRLWTENGLLTQAGTETYWDRSTLYGFRGVIACGEVDKAMDYLKFYSNRRLLGEHVPYAIEAWPEGSQRHLSAESGLYCRIFTEGLFGIRPTGLHAFDLTPRLPKEWNEMSLNRICAFGKTFDIHVQRIQKKLDVRILTDGKVVKHARIKDGATMSVSF
ncbi:MAG: hypothetical protein IJ726_05055 [Phocaeicola sp.]|nr:hypothetical protein [Phocaeicola sp.]